MGDKAVIGLLPCCTCLFWLVLSFLLRKKEHNLGIFPLLLLTIGFSSMAKAGLQLSISQDLIVSFFELDQLFSTAIIPIVFAYLRREESFEYSNTLMYSWLIIPVVLLISELILLVLSGKEAFASNIISQLQNRILADSDKTRQLLSIYSIYIYSGIIISGTLCLVIRTLVLRSKGLPNNLSVQAALLTSFISIDTATSQLLRISIPFLTVSIQILLSVSIYMLAYSVLFGDFHTMRRAAPAIQVPSESKDSQPFDNTAQSTPPVPKEPFEPPVLTGNAIEDRLIAKFQELIIKKKYYLNAGIRMSDIASRLGTNRTYISRMINNTYNISFSDYINTLRVEYAKQYLLSHKDAKLSEVAKECGFPTPSSFNNVFKKKTNVTPKVWIATNSNPS